MPKTVPLTESDCSRAAGSSYKHYIWSKKMSRQSPRCGPGALTVVKTKRVQLNHASSWIRLQKAQVSGYGIWDRHYINVWYLHCTCTSILQRDAQISVSEAMMLPLLDSNNQPVRRASVAEAATGHAMPPWLVIAKRLAKLNHFARPFMSQSAPVKSCVTDAAFQWRHS